MKKKKESLKSKNRKIATALDHSNEWEEIRQYASGIDLAQWKKKNLDTSKDKQKVLVQFQKFLEEELKRVPKEDVILIRTIQNEIEATRKELETMTEKTEPNKDIVTAEKLNELRKTREHSRKLEKGKDKGEER